MVYSAGSSARSSVMTGRGGTERGVGGRPQREEIYVYI